MRAILAKAPDLEVVGEAADGRQAVEMVVQLSPDVVVMDIVMPGLNGVEATRQLRAAHPQLKVIALSTFSDRQFVSAMREAGALGYVLKAASSDELLQAIRAVVADQRYPALAKDPRKAYANSELLKLRSKED